MSIETESYRRAFGLTKAEFETLVAVHYAAGRNDLSTWTTMHLVCVLVEKGYGYSQPSVCHFLNRIERLGLVERGVKFMNSWQIRLAPRGVKKLREWRGDFERRGAAAE